MKELQKLKLFPDNWWDALTQREIDKARAKLDAYATSSTLDTGVKEVSEFLTNQFRKRELEVSPSKTEIEKPMIGPVVP